MKKLNVLVNKISQLLAELLIILGLFFIIKTTFVLSTVIGMYLTGAILIAVGLFLAKER